MKGLATALALSLVVSGTVAQAQAPRVVEPEQSRPWAAYFSPGGGAAQAVVEALVRARHTVLIQAETLSSPQITKALTDAEHRGVKVEIILDRRHGKGRPSSADTLAREGVGVLIDRMHTTGSNPHVPLPPQGRSDVARVQEAAAEIERVTDDASTPKAPPGVTRVQIEKPKLNVREYLVTTLAGGAAVVGAGLIIFFLAFFLLASGDAFRRKWVKLSGPRLERRRVTVQVMDEIRSQIRRYLGVQVLTSAIVGVLSWLAFWAIGLENAAVWGVAAGVLNMVPYIGAVVTIGGTALVAFFQFGTVNMALAVAAISLVINSLEGYWLTPWLSGRASRMNNVVVFGGLLFWGWLWGGWGLILGLPIMMVVKAICDHVEDLKPVGEFMGE